MTGVEAMKAAIPSQFADLIVGRSIEDNVKKIYHPPSSIRVLNLFFLPVFSNAYSLPVRVTDGTLTVS